MRISGMVYERNIGQTLEVQVTGDNSVGSNPRRCENDSISNSSMKSLVFISPGKDSNLPADRDNQTPDSDIMDNTLYSMYVLCLTKKFYHFRKGKNRGEEIIIVSFYILPNIRDPTGIILHPGPGVNDVADTDPPPPVQRIRL